MFAHPKRSIAHLDGVISRQIGYLTRGLFVEHEDNESNLAIDVAYQLASERCFIMSHYESCPQSIWG